MTLGKKEQIVIGLLLTIIVIAVLHLTVYAPQQQRLVKAKEYYEEQRGLAGSMTIPGSEEDLQKYTSATQAMLLQLKEGLDNVGLDARPEFILPPSGGPPTNPPSEQYVAYINEVIQKAPVQIDAVMGEVARLVSYERSPATRFTFLAPGRWGIPESLPANVQSSLLWDNLNAIYYQLDMLNNASGTTKENAQAQYEGMLRSIGLDKRISNRLKIYGAYVPTIYELQILNLILKAAGTQERMMGQVPLNRDNLIKVLGVQSPSLAVANTIDDLNSYFLYNSLHFLNETLALAEKHKIPEVSEATLWGLGYLRQLPEKKVFPGQAPVTAVNYLADDRRFPYNYGTGKNASLWDRLTEAERAYAISNMGLTEEDLQSRDAGEYEAMAVDFPPDVTGGAIAIGAGGVDGAAPAPTQIADAERAPKEEDYAYAYPIELVFRAGNREGWMFIYDVLKSNPFNEIYRIEVRSYSSLPGQANNAELEFRVTFLFISKLFKTMNTVRDLVQQIEKPGAEPTPAGDAAAAPAPAP